MFEGFLVPRKTRVTSKGDGPALALNGAAQRVFLVTLQIGAAVEQEALDVSVWGSADGATWTAKPLLTFPQRFYVGDMPMLLDLSAQADIQYLRAHWELNRWGRGDTTPMFEFQVAVREVPPELLKKTS
jgi:hypothetical protein